MIPVALTAAILDLAFKAVAVGLERGVVVKQVADWERSGKSVEQIIDLLDQMCTDAENGAQAAVDAMPPDPQP